MAAESTSIVKPANAPTAVTSEFDAQTAPPSTLSAILGQTAQSDQASPPTQMAAISPAPPSVPAKRDYGWLSETILRRVEELKRYPASARVDRAEGKVVVKAVINEDGSLGEVEVFQSSGYPTLDKAAVETMRQAAPFHLPHPLGQPRMTIKIPMSYRLDR
jgi:protein TonB